MAKEVLWIEDNMYTIQKGAAEELATALNEFKAEHGLTINIDSKDADKDINMINKICGDLMASNEAVDTSGLSIESNFSLAREYVASTVRQICGGSMDFNCLGRAIGMGFNYASAALEFELVMSAIEKGMAERKEAGVAIEEDPTFKKFEVFSFDETISLEDDELFVTFEDGISLDGRLFTDKMVNGEHKVYATGRQGEFFTILHMTDLMECPDFEDGKIIMRTNDVEGVSDKLNKAREYNATHEQGYKFYVKMRNQMKDYVDGAKDGIYIQSLKDSSWVFLCDVELPAHKGSSYRKMIVNKEIEIDEILFNTFDDAKRAGEISTCILARIIK